MLKALYQIASSDRTYELNYPMLCSISNHYKGFIAEQQEYDVTGAGRTIEEAEQDFCDQFDFAYQHLSRVSDTRLSARLIKAKAALLTIVKNISPPQQT